MKLEVNLSTVKKVIPAHTRSNSVIRHDRIFEIIISEIEKEYLDRVRSEVQNLIINKYYTIQGIITNTELCSVRIKFSSEEGYESVDRIFREYINNFIDTRDSFKI